MTQTTVYPTGGREARTARSPLDWLSRQIRRQQLASQSTPGRMQFLSAALIVAALICGVTGAQALQSTQGALQRANKNVQQVVLIQDIQTQWAQADATATKAFLVGGLEPEKLRLDYDVAVNQISNALVITASAQPADQLALAQLSQLFNNFTNRIEAARANNRQAFPIGSQYLREASSIYRDQAVPQLDLLQKYNGDRVQTEFSSAKKSILWVVLTFPLALVLMALGLFWLAKKSHRYMNLPVSAAAVLLLVSMLGSWIMIGTISSEISAIRRGPYAATGALADARIAAYSAQSNENLTLITRGSGTEFEELWETANTQVLTSLDAAYESRGADLIEVTKIQESWRAQAALHKQIRTLDSSGEWDKAVELATREGDNSTQVFQKFDASLNLLLGDVSTETSTRLSRAEQGLTTGSIALLLAGFIAAGCAWWGISQRLEEYR